MGATMLTIQTTNLALDSFPDYTDPLESQAIDTMAAVNGNGLVNKLVGAVQDDPSRHPSPQPTHFSVPLKANGQNGHKVLRSATVGYIAPEFKGRAEQMQSGQFAVSLQLQKVYSLTRSSQGDYLEAGLDP